MLQSLIQVLLLLGRASLAAVLLAAGAAKLADGKGFATTLRGLGLPVRQEPFIRGLALLVPCIEVALGILSVAGLWSTVVNGLVLLLMCGFSLVVMMALRRKIHVACRCFGALSGSQFSGKGLVRSVLLVLLALLVFLGGRAYSFQLSAPPVAVLLLVAGFLLFALAAGQAAKSIAVLKERMV